MDDVDAVRAVVVKLREADYTERAWIACCMSEGSYDVIGEEDWQEWKAKALDLVLADWRAYEIREVVLRVSQQQLEGLFASGPIDAEVIG